MDTESTPNFGTKLQAALLASQRSRLRREQSTSGSNRSLEVPGNNSPVTPKKRPSDAPVPPLRMSNSSHNSSAISLNASSNALNVSDDEESDVLAASMLDASSAALRSAVSAALTEMLDATSQIDGDHPQKLTRDEWEAIVRLSMSPCMSIKRAMSAWVGANTELLPRGKQTVKEILKKATLVLTRGQAADDLDAITFALRVGEAIASEGETWAKRMVSDFNWDERLCELLLDVDDREVILEALHICVLLSSATSSVKYLRGCVRCVQVFGRFEDVMEEVCAVLSHNHPPIEDDGVLLLFLHYANEAASRSNYKLAADALRVVRPRSLVQAQKITRLFEESEAMNTLNALYRSQILGSKSECALFLEALVLSLDSDIESKVVLCESGVIIRLIRLASASSAASDEDGHEQAYLPAIRALSELAKVERIGARIVLAGGLGPLFAHANSSRPTRAQAKKALQALGVTNLGSVVESWIRTAKASQVENVEEPLEHVVLYGGSKLLWPSPPPAFFSSVVNDAKAVLGRGAFSVVYRAVLSDGKPVAVKRLTKAAAADPAFAEEIRVLARVPAHPNIVGLLGVYLNETECLIISELGGPTLASVLASEQDRIDWKQRVRILTGVADGIRHLHGLDPCILHLDLKASNILLVGEDRTPRLCDFGLAVELKPGFEFLLPGEHGTIQYMAPECMREDAIELARGFDVSADVYSFAMVMWEVAHPGRIPWQGETFELSESVDITRAIRLAVLSGRRPAVTKPDGWPPGYRELMESCWDKVAEYRPRFLANFFDEDEGNRRSRAPSQTIGSVLRKMTWEMKSQSWA